MKGRGAAANSDDGDDDDEDAFYEGSDAVGDWGNEGEQDEGEDVLGEVKCAVKEELQGKIRGYG